MGKHSLILQKNRYVKIEEQLRTLFPLHIQSVTFWIGYWLK